MFANCFKQPLNDQNHLRFYDTDPLTSKFDVLESQSEERQAKKELKIDN